MTPQELYRAFAFPESCALGKRVFKKLFHENGELTAADKRALSDAVKGISWQFTLKPSTIPVQPFRDEEREYEEIAVVELELSDRRAASRLARVVHRAIPYPVLLIFADDSGVLLSTATKRLSRAEADRIIADAYESTCWLDGDERSQAERAFIESLCLAGLPHTDFLALYEAWVERVVALACAELSQTFDLAPERPWSQRRARLDACRELERRLVSLRASIRGESSFARQVELNTEIKSLETELRRQAAAL